MKRYRVLGVVLLLVAAASAVRGNWLATAFCGALALACLMGKVNREVKDRPWS